jgi:hypothetical protein
MRFARGNVRDHIILAKIDYEPSCQRYSALQRRGGLKINFREIFGVDRFSTFATVSAISRRFPMPAIIHRDQRVGSGLLGSSCTKNVT